MLIFCNYCWLGLFKCLSAAFLFSDLGSAPALAYEHRSTRSERDICLMKMPVACDPVCDGRDMRVHYVIKVFLLHRDWCHTTQLTHTGGRRIPGRGAVTVSHGKRQKHLKALFLSHTPAEKKPSLDNLKSPWDGIDSSIYFYSLTYFWLKLSEEACESCGWRGMRDNVSWIGKSFQRQSKLFTFVERLWKRAFKKKK